MEKKVTTPEIVSINSELIETTPKIPQKSWTDLRAQVVDLHNIEQNEKVSNSRYMNQRVNKQFHTDIEPNIESMVAQVINSAENKNSGKYQFFNRIMEHTRNKINELNIKYSSSTVNSKINKLNSSSNRSSNSSDSSINNYSINSSSTTTSSNSSSSSSNNNNSIDSSSSYNNYSLNSSRIIL